MDSFFDWILQNPGLNHLTIKIFGFLDLKSFDNCLKVSKQWYQFIKENRNQWKRFSYRWLLHNACYSGYANIVKLLIELDYNINAPDANGVTPLSLACLGNHVEVVKLLCKQSNINVNAKVNNRTYHPVPILITSYQRPHIVIEIFKILLNHPKIDINAIDTFNNRTLLHYACGDGNTKAVEMLCRHPNINVNAKDTLGITPIMEACKGPENQTRFNIIERLCKHPNIDINAQDNTGKTALQRAFQLGQLNIMKILLDNKPDLIMDNFGETPTDLEKFIGNQNTVVYLNSFLIQKA